MNETDSSMRTFVCLLAVLCLPLGCSSERQAGPTGPSTPVSPIDTELAADLRTHVNDPFLQEWLPGYLGDTAGAQPIRALAHAISQNLERGDGTVLRQSLLAMPEELEKYRGRPGREPRDETILRAIEICIREALAILDGDRGPSSSASPALSEDRG
jgi:hypothetical protein